MRLPCVSSRALKTLRLPLAFSHNGQRHHSLHTKSYDVAVIGGGITGLTAAFRMSQDPTCSKVTLYEKSDYLGGWLQSETIPVDEGHVVFEYGPRTLRTAIPACLPLLDLAFELGLDEEILLTSKKDPASRNRYIYYPDHLVRLPSFDPGKSLLANLLATVSDLIKEPVFSGLPQGLLKELYTAIFTRGPPDESVADYIGRRVNGEVADNLVSAFCHGVYAGDIDRLSAQAVLGSIRSFDMHGDSVFEVSLRNNSVGAKNMRVDDLLVLESIGKPGAYWAELRMLAAHASAMTFKKGVGQLAASLVTALRRSKKVDIQTHIDVNAISQNPMTLDMTVNYGDKESRTHNRVIATNPIPSLFEQLSQPQEGHSLPKDTIKCLNPHDFPATTVLVVNLYYPNPSLLPVRGFGYLIPRSIPLEQNHECALGVIFGSESSIGQDTAPGTKLTVMLGGHWWDGWKESDYPDHDTAVQMSRTLLERHLGITDEPTLARSRLQENAIPQYLVNHPDRIQRLSQSARKDFRGRLTLAGSYYNGVGIADCVRQGYLASSFGVGSKRLNPGGGDRPWRRLGLDELELEGGLPMSPVQWATIYKSEMEHF